MPEFLNKTVKAEIYVPEKLESTAKWWLQTAILDFDAAVPKIAEYGGVGSGSADLKSIGYDLALLLNWDGVPEAVQQELGVWLYTKGKIARMISDYQQHKPGKADTWHDATVYSMMARRLQEVGQWP